MYVKIDLVKASNPPEKLQKPCRLNWGRSSHDQHTMYTQQLRDVLTQHEASPCLLHCDDVLCRDALHLQHIDNFTKELIVAMVDSAWENLEVSKGTTGDQAS